MNHQKHDPKRHSVPLIFWPFIAIWKFLAVLTALTGRLIAGSIGLVLLIIGIILSFTFIGAVIGTPLILLGLLLMARALF